MRGVIIAKVVRESNSKAGNSATVATVQFDEEFGLPVCSGALSLSQ